MYSKKVFSVLLIMMMSVAVLSAQNSQKSATDLILSSYSAKNFTQDTVSDKDIRTILECGIKAPSGMNRQPWKFTVIRDNALISEIIRNALPGNVLIIISTPEPSNSGSADFDCGLAMENMYVAAQGLGLGSHIYMTGVSVVNGKKDAYGIPEGYKANSILRIGSVPQTPDANSSASSRKAFEDIVIFK